MAEGVTERKGQGGSMFVVAVGWLQKVDNNERISKSGDNYFSMLLEVSEINEISNVGGDNSLRNFFVQSPVRLIFWRNQFDEEVYNLIANFKVGQNLTVRGRLRQDPQFSTAMISVKEVETSSELFIT